MAQTGLRYDDELDERLEARLSYGDTKSGWIRNAIRMRLVVAPVLDRLYEPDQTEERREFVEKAVIDAVNEELERQPVKGHQERMDRLPDEVKNGEE
jgi:hypothetical protein